MGSGSKKHGDTFASRASCRWGQGRVAQAGDQGCVLTVESLLVHDGAAAQGLVVLLAAHERVHAQDGCGDRGRPVTFHTPGMFAHGNGKKHLMLLH